MWPVFVFGTGRCGSTHIQRLITLSTCCWIWGEHEGFLTPLLESVSRCETSQELERNVFRIGPQSDDQVISDMTLGSEGLSWLNRFDRAEFRTEVASLIDRTFRSRVPKGWTEWGFKEIRYGCGNDAPETLLNLFPAATAVFTFREPKATIESMIRAWGRPGLLDSSGSTDSFSLAYRNCACLWSKVVKYFLHFRCSTDRKVFFISDDKLARSSDEILQVIGLHAIRTIPRELGITNPARKHWPEWASVKFSELFAKDKVEFLELFTRASAESDVDFSGRRLGTRTHAGMY
jgi:hypothetical protein